MPPVRPDQRRRRNPPDAGDHMAGKQLSAGRHLRRRRHQLRAVLRDRRKGRVVPDRRGRQRVGSRLDEVDGYVWHAYLPTISPGQRYGFRVHGPFDPSAGHRCDPSKLLLDPYGKSFDGEFTFGQALFSYDMAAVTRTTPPRPALPRMVDSLGHTMTSVVINPFFDWATDRAPRTPYHETVIYEAHVKGMTQTHPGIPEELRGTYAGLAHPAIIDHLKSLNVTAIELMPVHQFLHDQPAAGLGAAELLGLQHLRVLRPAQPVRRDPAGRRRGDRVQIDGPQHFTSKVSRSSSTWCTTTPPKATTSARRSTSAASTTPRTTGSSMTIYGSTRISPAPATASTPAIRTPCS